MEQYGNFTEPTTGLKLNGINTQGENIAVSMPDERVLGKVIRIIYLKIPQDNGGIMMAYKAYQNWVSEHGKEPIIPGFDFTPNQHFWLSAAQGNYSIRFMFKLII